MNPEQESSEQEPQPLRAPAPETVDQTKEGERLRNLEQERIQRAKADSAAQEGKANAERAEKAAGSTQKKDHGKKENGGNKKENNKKT